MGEGESIAEWHGMKGAMCVLTDVLTVTEVAYCWKVNADTVRYHLDRGNFRWRYTRGNLILIDKVSVIGMWGKPAREDNEIAVFEIRKIP